MAWPLAHPNLVGPLELVTAPTLWPVTVEEVRSQARIDDNTEDGFIADKIKQATEFVQNEVAGGRQFLSATWDMPLAGFWCGSLKIPRPPLQSITSIQYYATDGTLTTVSASDYLVRKPWKQPGHVSRAPNATWPSVQADREWPVVIRFVAGYAAATSLPHDWKQVVLLIVAHWFENREAVADTEKFDVPMAARSLIDNIGWGSYA